MRLGCRSVQQQFLLRIASTDRCITQRADPHLSCLPATRQFAPCVLQQPPTCQSCSGRHCCSCHGPSAQRQRPQRRCAADRCTPLWCAASRLPRHPLHSRPLPSRPSSGYREVGVGLGALQFCIVLGARREMQLGCLTLLAFARFLSAHWLAATHLAHTFYLTQFTHTCNCTTMVFPDDVDIQFARSSGAGGQNVNKVCCWPQGCW